MVFRFVPPIAFIDAWSTERTSFTVTCWADTVVVMTTTTTANITKTASLRIVRTSVVRPMVLSREPAAELLTAGGRPCQPVVELVGLGWNAHVFPDLDIWK